MERIEHREGEAWKMGGITFAVALARGGRLVLFANTGLGETAEDTIRAARRFREKVDKSGSLEDNSSV